MQQRTRVRFPAAPHDEDRAESTRSRPGLRLFRAARCGLLEVGRVGHPRVSRPVVTVRVERDDPVSAEPEASDKDRWPGCLPRSAAALGLDG